MKTPLKPYQVTICCFHPSLGPEDASAATYELPVDSPDEEHAIASTLANAASFTMPKYKDGAAQPVAFLCKGIRQRV